MTGSAKALAKAGDNEHTIGAVVHCEFRAESIDISRLKLDPPAMVCTWPEMAPGLTILQSQHSLQGVCRLRQLQRMWDSRVKTSHLQDWLAEDKEGLRRSEEREELKQGKHRGA